MFCVCLCFIPFLSRSKYSVANWFIIVHCLTFYSIKSPTNAECIQFKMQSVYSAIIEHFAVDWSLVGAAKCMKCANLFMYVCLFFSVPN